MLDIETVKRLCLDVEPQARIVGLQAREVLELVERIEELEATVRRLVGGSTESQERALGRHR